MSTEKKTPEQVAEEYFLGSRKTYSPKDGEHILIDIFRSQCVADFLAGQAQGRKDFIENELRGLLERARLGWGDLDWEYSIDELMKEAERK